MRRWHHATLLAAALLGGPIVNAEDDPEPPPVLKLDPFRLCMALDRRLPQALKAARASGQKVSIKRSPDLDYCHDDLEQCDIEHYKWPGVDLRLLRKKASGERAVLSARISTSRGQLLAPLRIGATVDEIANQFGVVIEPGALSSTIHGECTPLTLEHPRGRVTSAEIDCQMCI